MLRVKRNNAKSERSDSGSRRRGGTGRSAHHAHGPDAGARSVHSGCLIPDWKSACSLDSSQLKLARPTDDRAHPHHLNMYFGVTTIWSIRFAREDKLIYVAEPVIQAYSETGPYGTIRNQQKGKTFHDYRAFPYVDSKHVGHDDPNIKRSIANAGIIDKEEKGNRRMRLFTRSAFRHHKMSRLIATAFSIYGYNMSSEPDRDAILEQIRHEANTFLLYASAAILEHTAIGEEIDDLCKLEINPEASYAQIRRECRKHDARVRSIWNEASDLFTDLFAFWNAIRAFSAALDEIDLDDEEAPFKIRDLTRPLAASIVGEKCISCSPYDAFLCGGVLARFDDDLQQWLVIETGVRDPVIAGTDWSAMHRWFVLHRDHDSIPTDLTHYYDYCMMEGSTPFSPAHHVILATSFQKGHPRLMVFDEREYGRTSVIMGRRSVNLQFTLADIILIDEFIRILRICLGPFTGRPTFKACELSHLKYPFSLYPRLSSIARRHGRGTEAHILEITWRLLTKLYYDLRVPKDLMMMLGLPDGLPRYKEGEYMADPKALYSIFMSRMPHVESCHGLLTEDCPAYVDNNLTVSDRVYNDLSHATDLDFLNPDDSLTHDPLPTWFDMGSVCD